MAWTKCPCGHPLPCMSVGGVLSVFILFHHAVLLTESAFLNRRSEHETLGLTRKNPLLNVVEEDFPPFDSVQPDDVVPALTQLLDKAKDEVELFEQELQKPGFEPGVQTLLQPYSLLGEPLWAAHSVVSHLKSVKDSPELRKAMDVIRPKLVQHSERVSQSQPLFAAFQALRNSSSFAKLTPAQKRVVDLELQGFELGGIGLKGLARQEFNNITRKLSNLSTSYSENVLDSTKAWRKVVTTPTALRGIPEGPLRVAAQAARQEPIDGEVARLVKANANQSDEVLGPFLLTLDGPAAGAVLTYAEDPTLRKEVFIESAKRASELAQPDNTPVLKEMLQLRQRQAELLGFRNYVELSMQSKMATTTSAMKLMQQLQEVARPHAVADWDGLLQFVKVMVRGVDFHFVFFALIFVAAYPSIWPVAILGRRSLWSVCAYCSKNTPNFRLWLKFKPIWDTKLKPREAEVVRYSALAEVGLGVWLVVSVLLPTRQILTTVLYWNYLRTRYQMPRSHQQHAEAWKTLGDKAEPIFKAVPVLRKPVDMAQGWFRPQHG